MRTVDTAEVVLAYVRAWHERDEATRWRLLEETWADNGTYADPEGGIEGREALNAAIAEFQARRPDVRIDVRSAIDGFGRHFRFAWATVDGDGNVLREGIDVGELDPSDRIVTIVAFFGVTP